MARSRGGLLLKIGLGLLGLALVAVVAGTWALKKYLPPEKVRALVLDNAGKALQREVRLESVDLNVVTGLSLKGLEISEAPNFGAGTFVRAEAFQVRLQLMPLLSRQIAVDKLSVKGLKVAVVKRKDGAFNFSDLLKPTPAKAPAAGAKAFELDVNRLALEDCAVDFRDLGTGDAVAVSGIEAQIKGLRLDRPFDAELELKADGRYGKKPVAAQFAFAGRVDPAKGDLEKAGAEFTKLLLKVPEGEVSASGKVKGAKAPVLDVKAELKTAQGQVFSIAAAGQAASLSAEAPEAALKVELKTPALKAGELKPYGVAAHPALPPIAVAADFDLKGDALKLKSVSLSAPGAKAQGSGTINRWREKLPDFNLSLSGSWELPAQKPEELAWLKSYGVKLPDGLGLPALAVSGSLQVDPAKADIKELKVSSERLSARVSGTAKLPKQGRPDLDLSVSFDLNLPKITQAEAAFLKAYGVAVPADLSVPPTRTQAELGVKTESVELKSLKFKTEGAALAASGRVDKFWSAKPAVELDAKLDLKLPALKAGDLAVLKLAKLQVPPQLSWPPSEVALDARLAGDDLTLRALKVRSKGIDISASGMVRKALSSPEPILSLDADIDLPAFTSAEVAFVKAVPPDLSIPASKLKAKIKGDRDAVEIPSVSLDLGSNKLRITDSKIWGLRSKAPQYNLTVSGKFVLGELTQFSAKTKEMKLAGEVKAAFSIHSDKPMPKFNLQTEFSGLGAEAAGYSFSEISGGAKGDHLDFRGELSAKLDGKPVKLKFRGENFHRRPHFYILTGSRIDEINLAKTPATPESAQPAAASAPAAEPKDWPVPIDLDVDLDIGRVMHSKFGGEEISLRSSLTDVSPSLKGLDGTAKFWVNKGYFQGVDNALAALIVPKLARERINLVYRKEGDAEQPGIIGEFKFSSGKGLIQRFNVYSEAVHVTVLNDPPATFNPKTMAVNMHVQANIGSPVPVWVSCSGPLTDKKSCALAGKRYVKEAVVETIKSPEKVKKTVEDLLKNPGGLLKLLPGQGGQ